MKQKTFFIGIVACNILFLFLYIYKQNTIINLTYTKQKNEKKKAELMQYKEELSNRLHELQEHSSIKKAAQELSFKPTPIKKIHHMEK